MTMARFGDVLQGRETSSPYMVLPSTELYRFQNQSHPQQLVKHVNGFTVGLKRCTIILEIGIDPELAENAIRLNEPSVCVLVAHL
jgi:hypothetical protein